MKVKDHRVLRILFDLFGHRQCLVEFELELSHEFLLICGSYIERSCFIVQVGDFSLFEEHLLLFEVIDNSGLDLSHILLCWWFDLKLYAINIHLSQLLDLQCHLLILLREYFIHYLDVRFLSTTHRLIPRSLLFHFLVRSHLSIKLIRHSFVYSISSCSSCRSICLHCWHLLSLYYLLWFVFMLLLTIYYLFFILFI